MTAISPFLIWTALGLFQGPGDEAQAAADRHERTARWLAVELAARVEPPAAVELDRALMESWAATCRGAGLRGLVLAVREREGASIDLGALAEVCRAHGLALGLDFAQPSPRELRGALEACGELFELRFEGLADASLVALARELRPAATIVAERGPDASLRRAGPGFEIAAPLETPELPAPAVDGIDGVGQLQALLALVDASVGWGANLLIELELDSAGQPSAEQRQRLLAMRRAREASAPEDVAAGRRASASNVRGGLPEFGPAMALDDDPGTYWTPEQAVSAARIEVFFDAPAWVDRVELAEPAELLGRIESFALEAVSDGALRSVAKGGRIGSSRVLRFPALHAGAMRLSITRSSAAPAVSRLAVFRAQPRVAIEPRAPIFLDATAVRLIPDLPGAAVHYTLDGREPTAVSPRFERPFRIEGSLELRAIAFLQGARSPFIESRAFERIGEESLKPALHLFREPSPGIAWRRFGPRAVRLDELGELEPVASGVNESLAVEEPSGVAVELRGYLRIPTDGVFGFQVVGGGRGLLEIDRERVLAGESAQAQGWIGLRGGWHALRLVVIANAGERPRLEMQGLERPPASIPPDWLGH